MPLIKGLAFHDLRHFLPAVAWSSFILLVSWNVSGLNLPQAFTDLPGIDKLGHAVVYTLLAVFFLYGFRKKGIMGPGTDLLILIWCSCYGWLMEILQYFCFPGRYFEYYDLLANITGVLFGIFFFKFALRQFAKQRSNH